MLRFKANELQVGRRHFILLPKMTTWQTEELGRRLESLGYAPINSTAFAAAKGDAVIHIEPAGLCWSTVDPADAILPAMAGFLELPKEQLQWDELLPLYVGLAKAGEVTTARLSTRVEGYSNWDELRAKGLCALSPDEHAVTRFLIRSSSSCNLLTDFVTDSSSIRRCGKRIYYEAELARAEAERTLGIVGKDSPKSSYLPRNGLLTLHGFTNPTREEWIDLIAQLGEWCYFVPSPHESSNS